MNKVFKTVLYVLIGILALTVLTAFVLSFFPKFKPTYPTLFKVTDFIYLPIPLIGILVMLLIIDYRNRDEGGKKEKILKKPKTDN